MRNEICTDTKTNNRNFLRLGVEVKFKDCHYPVMLQPTKVPELNAVKKCVKGLIVGAAVTIDQLENELNKLICTMPGEFNLVL